MGVAWDTSRFYEKGLLRGKQAMMIVAAGHPTQYYSHYGKHRATTTQILHPINHGTLAFCGFNVHEPFVATNVLGMDATARTKSLNELHFRMIHLNDSPVWLENFS